MICEICQTRNPAGFCVTCEKALCEECSSQCEECGKMACPECVDTTRRGKLLCSNCMEERRAKKAESRAKVKAGAAPAEGEVPEEEEEFPEPVRRLQVRPWVASLALVGLGVLLSLFFLWAGGAVHWSVLFLPLLGTIWGLVGVLGRSEQKAQAVAGIVLNLVLVLLVLWPRVPLEAPWIDTEKEAEQKQAQELTPEQKFQQRRQERQNLLRRLNPEQ